MTRKHTAWAALGFITLLIALDLAASQPNPYTAPPLFAFGSGTAPSGGFCAALPE
jgi:ribosomal protein L11 methylase PrmA